MRILSLWAERNYVTFSLLSKYTQVINLEKITLKNKCRRLKIWLSIWQSSYSCQTTLIIFKEQYCICTGSFTSGAKGVLHQTFAPTSNKCSLNSFFLDSFARSPSNWIWFSLLLAGKAGEFGLPSWTHKYYTWYKVLKKLGLKNTFWQDRVFLILCEWYSNYPTI